MLEEKILNTITKYKMIESGDSIVIGVSGGPDSMCLLQALIQIKEKKKLNYKIYVAHINHGLRKEAEGETKYVQDFCAKNNIECFVKKENVKFSYLEPEYKIDYYRKTIFKQGEFKND